MSTSSLNSNQIKAAQAIKDGFYTIVYACGAHRTFRVESDANFANGAQVIGFMSGTDNTSDYTNFGFLRADGSIQFWKKFAANSDETKLRRIRFAVSLLLQDSTKAGQAYALNSGKCYRCNRLLTNPESIALGIGPDCLKKYGA